jgi:hypothetical protein
MKNLVDGVEKSGAVRGINAAMENIKIDYNVFDGFDPSSAPVNMVTETVDNKRTFYLVHGTSRS